MALRGMKLRVEAGAFLLGRLLVGYVGATEMPGRALFGLAFVNNAHSP